MRASLLLAVIFVCIGPLQATDELEHVAYSNLDFDPPVPVAPNMTRPGSQMDLSDRTAAPTLFEWTGH